MGRLKRLKKLIKVPKRISGQKLKGAISIRPISFHMDRTIDKYVVTGGGFLTYITQNKRMAKRIAKARLKLLEKRKRLDKW